MNAMILLKAMSEIAPEDIEAAMQAGAEPKAVGDADFTDTTEQEGSGAVIRQTVTQTAEPDSGRHLRIGGLVAAAACLMLVIGTVMFFRSQQDDFVLTSSVPEVLEETGTIPAETTGDPLTQTTAKTDPPQQNHTNTGNTAAVTAEHAASQDNGAAETQTEAVTETTTEMTAAETTTAVTFAAEVPVLVAMADDAGTLTKQDGSAYADGEATAELLSGQDAVQHYLDSQTPAVTLGEGQKSAEAAAKIRKNPVLYRIRWQMHDAKWSSYGIRSAKIDGSGVLHLQIAMYSDGMPQAQPDWIYETGLLYEAGTLPEITDVSLELTYFEDTDGIEQWIAYQAALEDDLYVRTETEN